MKLRLGDDCLCHNWFYLSAFIQRGYTVLVESLLIAMNCHLWEDDLQWIEFRLTVYYLPSFFLLSDSEVDWVGSKDDRYDFQHPKLLVTIYSAVPFTCDPFTRGST